MGVVDSKRSKLTASGGLSMAPILMATEPFAPKDFRGFDCFRLR